jgi:hypothetical protein
MRLNLLSCVMLAAAACLAALPAFADEAAGPNRPDGATTPKSVTVFPIVLNSGKPIAGVSADMSKNMAELVGLFLERGGIQDVEIADAQFVPPEKDDLPQVSEAFGQFVKSRKLSTEYALYGQFFGTPGKGLDELRLVAVDRQGKVVLSERRDRQQLSQLGEAKVDLMIASSHLVSRLQGLWGLAAPTGETNPKGKMAQLWREKSGLPPESEIETMHSRLDALKKTIKTATIAVFPVQVSGKGDESATTRLAAMLTKEALGQADAVNTELKFDIKPSSNQVKIGWDIARAFQEFLRKNPPSADYALFVSYGIGRTSDGKPVVGGVQLILCDRKGDWVLATGRNEHQPDFQAINPQTPDDCNRLVIEVLKSELR